MQQDIKEKALEAHKQWRGKIEVTPKEKLTREGLGLMYTPGVGAVSSFIANHPESANEYTMRGNSVAVISDGTAVLGLGDIGPLAAMPVMEGKALLFKSLAGIDAFPVVLNTKDADEIVRIVQALEPTFGAVNLEDIAAPKCFDIERRLKESMRIPVMHDDQHGTAMVVLAGLINALRLRGSDKKSVKVVISGAGAAGTAIADLLLLYGFEKLVMLDSAGAIYKGRVGSSEEKELLAARTNTACHIDTDHEECVKGGLEDALVGADVFVGVSKGGVLTKEMIGRMNAQPIIFALANPIPEIYPDEALAGGALTVATGRSDFANQINNALGFPGIFRGALDNGVSQITDTMLIRAAEALASLVEQPTPECIIPDVFDERVVPTVANAIRE